MSLKFSKFVVQDYKAIEGKLEVNVSRNQLVPIIGVNESGKTSVLGALFAFDRMNDRMNDSLHLNNPVNLYKTTNQKEPLVTAEIEVSEAEFIQLLNKIKGQISKGTSPGLVTYKAALRGWTGPLVLQRNIKTREYTILNPELGRFKAINKLLVVEIIRHTPYILYFDDFRDSIKELVAIPASREVADGWVKIIDQLFRRTDPSYTVFDLKGMDELKRRSVLGDVSRNLNSKLTKLWQDFALDDAEEIMVDIGYTEVEDSPHLRLSVRERIEGGMDRYFGIRDRSKGFYWFFNFVMKLEFNPKVRSMKDKDTIYLLDEPGSYLHASAQQKLCQKLTSLSRDNIVIYCTHSHYLLDPEIIPLSKVRVAKKSAGSIRLIPLFEFKEDTRAQRFATQPILDALRIKPFVTDLTHPHICITEGIIDYYVFEMFKKEGYALQFLPSVGADSIAYFISISLAWGVKYIALWDNDEQGRSARDKAIESFGAQEAEKFLTLQLKSKTKVILQDLFYGDDLRLIKTELSLPSNTAFASVIIALYFSPQRDEILTKMSDHTKDKIAQQLDAIHTKFEKNYVAG